LSAFVSTSVARDFAQILLFALARSLLVATTVQTVHVIGISMSPTLSSSVLLRASKLDYRIHDPQRGDVVILKDPMDPSKDFIRRIIGLPGDRVLIRDRHVFVNGVRLEEPYLAADWNLTSN